MSAPLRCREQRALRRLMPRRLLVLTVQGGGVSQPAYGLVNDISDSGAGIVADRLLPSGREVRIRICFYPQVCFDTDARVVWGRDAIGSREGYGLALNGVRFGGVLAPLISQGLNGRRVSRQDSLLADSLEYLEYRVPNYPFDPGLDKLFLSELLADFPEIDLLEEIKTFRWNFDERDVLGTPYARVALRRWVAAAHAKGLPAVSEAPQNGGNHGYRNAAAFLSKETFGSWVSFLKA